MDVDSGVLSGESAFEELIRVCRVSDVPVDYSQIDKTLKRTFEQLSQKQNGGRLEKKFMQDLAYLMETSSSALFSSVEKEVLECVTNCFRILRNACAICTDNQTLIQSQGGITSHTGSLLQTVINFPQRNEQLVILSRCAVQFLGNYATGNIQNQVEVWKKFHGSFSQLLQFGDEKLTQYVCMVLHTSLAGAFHNNEVEVTQESITLMTTVLEICVETDCTWGLYVIEDLLQIPSFCSSMDDHVSSQKKILILEVLMNHLKSLQDDSSKDERIPALQNLQHIAKHFKSQAYFIVTMATDLSQDGLVPFLIVKELECLCIATSHHKIYAELQEDLDLLTCSLSLLQRLDSIGRQGNNIFSSLLKVSETHDVDEDHPVYGLKKDLIRLVGNMVYRHRVNQDKVREMEGIPLILDQTSIDGRNPYITQWSVFAVHNLCEDNQENKAYIAGLKLQGLENNQAVLSELGLTAEAEEDKVVIKKQKR